MTIETWPAAFPARPLAPAVSFGVVSPVERTETEHLLPLQRQRSATPAVLWQVAWRFENTGAGPTQWQMFQAWVRYKLADATLPFTWPVWDGLTYVNTTAWFDGDPTAGVQVAGQAVIVTAQLFVIDPPIISEAALDTALGG